MSENENSVENNVETNIETNEQAAPVIPMMEPIIKPVIVPVLQEPVVVPALQDSEPKDDKKSKGSRKAKKEKNKREGKSGESRGLLVPILASFLIASVIFSGFQTVYIFGLTTGKYGVMSYTRDEDMAKDAPKTEKPSAKPKETVDVNNLPDPEFSLEQAASVTDPNKKTLSIPEIVDTVSPATVSIFIMSPMDSKPDTAISSGSGFIITKDGYVVTNAHVVDSVLTNSSYYVVVDIPGHDHMIKADIIGTDVQTDIAVIKLEEAEDYPTVILGDSETLRVGELVVAIGNPLGTLQGTVTAGVVSATDREMNNNGYSMELLQTDASINQGNSGGPLINSFGEVIGVTNAKMGSAEGLGFAIPISSVKFIIESIINYGQVIGRTYLGISVSTITDDAYYGAKGGVYVAELAEPGPGTRAGFKVGDRIISVDGVEITQSNDIIEVRDQHKVGDIVVFVIERDGETMELELTIGDSSEANES